MALKLDYITTDLEQDILLNNLAFQKEVEIRQLINYIRCLN